MSLVTEDLVGRVALLFEKTIEASWDSHPMRKMTQAEVKRRFGLCASIFERLRGDLKWGIDRIAQHLPAYFRAELDGAAWTPDSRTFWLPKDGAVPMGRDGEPLEPARDTSGILLPGEPGFSN
jgi:hypothetical protein